MPVPHDDRPPFAVAMQWVGRIFAVSAEMVLPGLLGQHLDRRWGTNYLVLAGFAFGLSVGLWHLILMTRQPPDQHQGSSTTKDAEP